MIQLSIGSATRVLPNSWGEVGPGAWQLLKLLVRNPVGLGKAKALKELTGLNWYQWRLLNENDISTLDAGTPWLGIGPHPTPFRDRVRVGFKTYHMPLPNFENGSGIGYTLADEYFDQWIESGQGDDANLLLATLLCVHRQGERVPPGSREEVERRANRLRHLGPEWAAQALMYWMATRQYVHDTYGDWLFNSTDAEEQQATRPGFSLGWWGLWMDVAKDGLFGTVEQVHATNFHTLCVYLIKQEEAARAQRREMEKMKLRNRAR